MNTAVQSVLIFIDSVFLKPKYENMFIDYSKIL